MLGARQWFPRAMQVIGIYHLDIGSTENVHGGTRRPQPVEPARANWTDEFSASRIDHANDVCMEMRAVRMRRRLTTPQVF